MGNTYGHTVIVALTNKSGGALIAGDVVIIDTTNDSAVTTTTSAGYTGRIGVAQESIANNATGRFAIEGEVALVNVNASVTRGNYGKTHTVAKQATDAGASRVAGTFCQFTTGGTTPRAILYPVDLAGTALADPTSNRGEIIRRGAASLEALQAKTAGYVVKGDGTDVTAGYIPFSGCRAFNSGTQTITNVAAAATFDSEDYDTDSYHSTASNTGRLTVPRTGYYQIKFSAYWNNAPTPSISWYLRKNGSTNYPFRRLDTNYVTWMEYGATVYLTAADYVEMMVVQGAAGGKQLGVAGYETTFEIVFLGV